MVKSARRDDYEKAFGYLNAAVYALSKAVDHFSKVTATHAKRQKLERISRELQQIMDKG